MDFKEKLNEYIEQLGCTSKELAQASGLSAATISRYRSGDRLPQWDSENYNKLIAGLSGLAQENASLLLQSLPFPKRYPYFLRIHL